MGALVCAAGAAVYDHRESLLLSFGAEGVHPKYAQAVSLAKSARTFVPYHTNSYIIAERATEEGGAVDPDGWSVERVGDSLFIVNYGSALGERTVDYAFEVDIALREVRLLRDDPGRLDATPATVR